MNKRSLPIGVVGGAASAMPRLYMYYLSSHSSSTGSPPFLLRPSTHSRLPAFLNPPSRLLKQPFFNERETIARVAFHPGTASVAYTFSSPRQIVSTMLLLHIPIGLGSLVLVFCFILGVQLALAAPHDQAMRAIEHPAVPLEHLHHHRRGLRSASQDVRRSKDDETTDTDRSHQEDYENHSYPAYASLIKRDGFPSKVYGTRDMGSKNFESHVVPRQIVDTKLYNDSTMPEPNKEYTLVVTREWYAPDGFSRMHYLINGQYPAPLLIFDEDDWVRIEVTNNCTDPFTIHGHGLWQVRLTPMR